MLLLCALIWGVAFVAQIRAMENLRPFAFTALRFSLALLVILPFRLKSGEKNGRPGRLKAGLILGFFLFAGTNLQQLGLLYTTAGKAGFITGLYICIIPLLLFIFWKIRLSAACLGAIGVATAGLFLLSVQEDFTPAPGDLWVLACAVVFAMHVILIGRFAALFAPLDLAFYQTAVCVVLSAAVSLAYEDTPLAAIWNSRWALLYAGGLSAGFAYTMQIFAQRYVAPAHSALILSLESVFAAVAGWILLSEIMTGRQIAGCFLMLAGVVWAERENSRLTGSFQEPASATRSAAL